MKKNILKLVVIAFTALSVAGVATAQDSKAEKTGKSSADSPKVEKSTKAKSGTATGEVTSVDPKSGQLMVKAKDKDLNLMAESKSAKSALDKVKVGDTVRVTYTDKDGKMVVSSVKTESKGTSKSEEKRSSTEKKAEKKQP
jgi:ribosomal 50S subunit-recycling heat shock protein